MRIRRDACIRIDPINEEELRKVVTSPNSPVSLYKRAKVILLLGEKVSPSEAARRVGLHRANVYRWAKRYYYDGASGLRDLPRKRKPRTSDVAVPILEHTTPSVGSPTDVMSQ
jgi:hypothetical protein